MVLTWQSLLKEEKNADYFTRLLQRVAQEREAGKEIYPPRREVFNAFRFTPFASIRVVILGQDPYHGPNQANGLAFSVRQGMVIPPSLRNIYKELGDNFSDFTPPSSGDLTPWAKQGVLLLNSVLTVERGCANAHKEYGWEEFTDRVVALINQYKERVVFLLWGAHAQRKGAKIDRTKHLVLTAPHPSPLAAYRGFFGCRHFIRTNEYLAAHGKEPINWQIP